MMKKTAWIARTAICLALLLCLQFVTKSLGQFVTGSCVNLVIAMAALIGGLWSGLTVAIVSPFCAYLLGIGPAFVALVPCVALGNAVYALIFGLLVRAFLLKKKAVAAIISMALGAVLKFLALYIVLVKLVAPNVVPQAKYATVTAAFTWPQLITALIGGVRLILRLDLGKGGLFGVLRRGQLGLQRRIVRRGDFRQRFGGERRFRLVQLARNPLPAGAKDLPNGFPPEKINEPRKDQKIDNGIYKTHNHFVLFVAAFAGSPAVRCSISA